MKKRIKLSKSASRHLFRGGNRVAVRNISPRPMRGGIRL